MPKLKTVEKRIWDVEDFEIAFRQNGRDVNGQRKHIPQYPYLNAAKHGMSVAEWKRQRFNHTYPGFDVAVYDGDGQEITAGQTLLGGVRDSYSDDE